MTVKEMIYEFMKELEVVSPELVRKDVPDTTTIVHYLNMAYRRYVRTRYLYGKSIKENSFIIQKASDDLHNLIIRVSLNVAPVTSTTDPFAGISSYVNISSLTDFYHYIRSDSYITRTSVVPIVSSDAVPNELITYDEIEQYITTPYNYPILSMPKVFFQSTDLIIVIYDINTTYGTTNAFNLTYLKKPKILIDEYTKTNCYRSVTTTFDSSDTVIVTLGTITYPSAGGTIYTVGQIFTIVPAQLSVIFTSGNEGCLLGNYTIETQTCELAEYTHEEIARLGVTIYLDELKFKLLPKSNQQ